MLDLGLETSDCLYKLPLLFKACIPDELRMIHLHHLKLLGSCKFLLNQCLFFSSMSLLNFVDLRHVTLLILTSLLLPHILNLVVQFDHFLGVIRL